MNDEPVGRRKITWGTFTELMTIMAKVSPSQLRFSENCSLALCSCDALGWGARNTFGSIRTSSFLVKVVVNINSLQLQAALFNPQKTLKTKLMLLEGSYQ